MTETRPTVSDIQQAIRSIPDFPKAGILFKDITPLLADARLFAGSIDLLTANFEPGMVDAVVGIDARGFIFAAAATQAACRICAGPQEGKAAFSDSRAGLLAGIRHCYGGNA